MRTGAGKRIVPRKKSIGVFYKAKILVEKNWIRMIGNMFREWYFVFFFLFFYLSLSSNLSGD